MRIFDFIKQIINDNPKFWNELSDKERKEFNPYMIIRWFRGAQRNRNYHIVATNEVVNKFVFSLRDHPQLLFQLLCLANGTKEYTRLEFIKRTITNMPESLRIVQEYYCYNEQQALDVMKILDINDILDIADALGVSNDVIKKLEKEHE